MNEIPAQKDTTRQEYSESNYRTMKTLGGILLFLGPILPLTIGLWHWAVRG